MALIDGLLSYWKLDVNETPQPDELNNHNATVTGATFTGSGKINGAYSFDGNDRLEPGVMEYASGDFTIGWWVKTSTAHTTNDVYFGHSNKPTDNSFVLCGFDGSTHAEFSVRNSITVDYSVVGTSDVEDGAWHFIICEREGNTIRLFVDNSQEGSDVTIAGTINDDTVQGIGAFKEAGTWFGHVTAILDDGFVYTRILTSEEKTQLWNGGAGFQYPFLVPPVAAFSADNTTILIGETVNYTDESTENPTSWSWVFESGTPPTSTDQNPSVVYNTTGLFDVSLEATNTAGSDTESKVDYITVEPLPPPPSGGYVENKRKELKTKWPFEKGLTARTQSQTGRVMNLVPQKSLVPRRLKVGLR